jgi:hypothetical protein
MTVALLGLLSVDSDSVSRADVEVACMRRGGTNT